MLEIFNFDPCKGFIIHVPMCSCTCHFEKLIILLIDHKIISMVILLPSAESFKKGCCQLQVKVCAQSTGKPPVQACPGESVVR